ncbi:MAG: 30S ribosomal protein S20 [Candidatus Nealsonbacteria bacterium]
MPITTSAKKALRQSKTRKIRNTRRKKEMKNLLKKVKDLVSQNKIEEVKKLLPRVYKVLDKAAKAGLIKKNTAGRKKSRITKSILRPR